ncbi:hypothetical protein ES705_17311 [subsurface metagenome]
MKAIFLPGEVYLIIVINYLKAVESILCQVTEKDVSKSSRNE